ncbi:MAG: helix-turn-helix domain-containing protein [Thiohalorhabdus sp.]|uniref:helix-turn-helix domain-containing protein n=1 Tax=Thiohalorhabdus sp. TaxID=3094134 RepID=UPI003980A9DE
MTPLALLTLLGCVATLQYHSVLWWLDQVGWSGVAISLVLEVVAVWFWFRPGWGRVFGAAASVIVLAGPLHHTAAPLFQARDAAAAERAAVSAKLDSLRDEIQTQRQTLAGYRERSEERVGWRDVQERASETLAELRDRERDLVARQAAMQSSGPVALELVTLLQLGALLLFQMGTITSVTHLSAAYRRRQHPETPRNTQPQQAAPEDPRLALAGRLDRHMADRGLSQSAVADAAGVPRQEVGRALRHAETRAQGGRTASATTWQRLGQYLQQEERAK